MSFEHTNPGPAYSAAQFDAIGFGWNASLAYLPAALDTEAMCTIKGGRTRCALTLQRASPDHKAVLIFRRACCMQSAPRCPCCARCTEARTDPRAPLLLLPPPALSALPAGLAPPAC